MYTYVHTYYFMYFPIWGCGSDDAPGVGTEQLSD